MWSLDICVVYILFTLQAVLFLNFYWLEIMQFAMYSLYKS